MLAITFYFFTFALGVLATPTEWIQARSGTNLTVQKLIRIAPQSQSCKNAPFPAECRTAHQAVPHIVASFEKYKIKHAAVQAALISLMVYESAEFKYNINHYPGTPGQGTRNMQMPEFNEKYALDLGFDQSLWEGQSDGMQALIDEVGKDKYTFASAAWFIKTQCDFSVRQRMWSGSQADYENYLTECIQTDVNDDRIRFWQAAMKVLGT